MSAPEPVKRLERLGLPLTGRNPDASEIATMLIGAHVAEPDNPTTFGELLDGMLNGLSSACDTGQEQQWLWLVLESLCTATLVGAALVIRLAENRGEPPSVILAELVDAERARTRAR